MSVSKDRCDSVIGLGLWVFGTYLLMVTIPGYLFLTKWFNTFPDDERPDNAAIQRGWDDIVCKRVGALLLGDALGFNFARVRAATKPELGAWFTLPSPS